MQKLIQRMGLVVGVGGLMVEEWGLWLGAVPFWPIARWDNRWGNERKEYEVVSVHEE